MPDLEFTSAVQALLSSKIFCGYCVDGSEHELHANIKQTSETFSFWILIGSLSCRYPNASQFIPCKPAEKLFFTLYTNYTLDWAVLWIKHAVKLVLQKSVWRQGSVSIAAFEEGETNKTGSGTTKLNFRFADWGVGVIFH